MHRWSTQRRAVGGVVSAPRAEAVEVGERIMREGGNAVDAAVAMTFVLFVCEPYMTGLGGVGEAVYLRPDGRCIAVDAVGIAPLAAAPGMFDVEGGELDARGWFSRVRGDENAIGIRAVMAPRLVSGLWKLHSSQGRVSWSDVLSPAIELATEGAILDYLGSAVLVASMRTLARDPLAGVLYYPSGLPIAPPIMSRPARISNPALVESLEAIRETGPSALSSGTLGASILSLSRARGGVLEPEDLACESEVIADVSPLLVYRGWSVYGNPRPSGALTVATILGLLERLEPPTASASNREKYEAVVRSCAAATRERNCLLAGDLSEEGVRALLSSAHLDKLAGSPGGSGSSTGSSLSSTTTCSACDAEGGACCVTSTLLSFFGAHISVPEHGFFLNNGMQWFDPLPGHVNSIASGKRALSAMASLVLRDSQSDRVIAVGGLGGRFIFTAVAQAVHNLIRHDCALDEAINLPRVHVDGSVVLADERLVPYVESLEIEGLAEVIIGQCGPTSLQFARLAATEIDRKTKAVVAALDRRATGARALTE